MTDLEKQMAEALRGLLNDTQHARHDDCHDGPCPVREARDALAKFDAQAAEQAAGGGEAVAEFMGRRRTPEGTSEFWGFMLCDSMRDPPKGSKLYTHPALSDAEIDALRRDAERIQHFERMADQGYCPSLVFDDDGRWAVSYSGVAPVPDDGGHQTTAYITVEVQPDEWKPSVREAIDAALAAAR